jgi:hypothetical protein
MTFGGSENQMIREKFAVMDKNSKLQRNKVESLDLQNTKLRAINSEQQIEID